MKEFWMIIYFFCLLEFLKLLNIYFILFYFLHLCFSGFTGVTCAENIDECSSQPCFNSGVCEDKQNEYKCNCLEGNNNFVFILYNYIYTCSNLFFDTSLQLYV